MLNNWQLGNVLFDSTRRVLILDAQQHYLEPRIYELLLALITAPQQQLSREQLIDLVWQGRVVSESAINRAVSMLRKAFAQLDPSQPYLETLPKVGYRLLVPVVPAVVPLPPDTEPVIVFSEQIVSASEVLPEPIAIKRPFYMRRGGWLLGLLLILFALNLYWQHQHSAADPLPAHAAPTPRTSDEGVEFHLSLSGDGQWFSYLQQEGPQRRWFLQPSAAAATNQQRLQVEVPAGDVRFTSLSPDRNWLLYELCQQQACTLWLKASPIAADADTSANAGAGVTAQTDMPLLQLPLDSQLQLSWQQDSQAFYFRKRLDKTKPYALSRMDLATKAVQQLTQPVTPGGDVALAISADGSQLAVVSYLQQGKSVLRIYQRQNMKILAEQQVSFAVTTIAWQNDAKLLFGCGEQICRWDVAAQQVQPLLNTGAPLRSLFWQRGQLWYSTVQHKMEIWRQPRPEQTQSTLGQETQGAKSQLATVPEGKVGTNANGEGHWPAPEKVISSSRIDWMPRIAGQNVVFLTNRQGAQQIWRQSAGQSEQLLATLPPPAEFVRLALSADGKELVFSQQGAIYLLDIPSGKLQQILDASAKAAVVNFGADFLEVSTGLKSGSLIYSSTRSGDYQLWKWDRSTGQSTQLTTQGGYSGFLWQGELWYSKYHQDGLYRLNPRGEEQRMLDSFDKINWLNWQLQDGELYFYQPGQGLMQWSISSLEIPPRLLLPTPERFMHHYQWTEDALWYVKRAQDQGDIYQVALP
jgi:transcriptional activator of cad operon